MEYKFQKQTEKQWTTDKGISSDVKYLPAFEKIMDRKVFSIAKVAIDLEKRHTALKETIALMIKEVKAARVKDFPGGPPAIKTFTCFDKSVKIEVAQGATYEFDKNIFYEAKQHFIDFIEYDDNQQNKMIKDALSKVFSVDDTTKRSVEIITDFSKRFVDNLKNNESFQEGLKALQGVYVKESRDYYRIFVMTDNGGYKKISLNLNEIE